MPHAAVLAVDPDRVNLMMLYLSFAGRGWDVDLARTHEEALARVRVRRPGLAIVNLDLGEAEAPGLLRAMRQEFAAPRVPVLLVARRGQEDRAAAALEEGAHDVVFVPEDERRFGERAHRMIAWRARPGEGRYVAAGPVVLDVDRAALVSPRPAERLTPCEAGILRWLLTPPGRTYSRRQLLAAHRPSFPPRAGDRSVDVHVASLRRKLGRAGACIEALRGVGYRFEPSAAS